CRRAPLTARGRRPGAGSSPLFEHLAGCELLAPAVEQIAKAQRLAARQLQASEQQRALTTSDFQAVLAGSDDLTGIALPCANLGCVNLHHCTVEAGMADRPGMECADQSL